MPANALEQILSVYQNSHQIHRQVPLDGMILPALASMRIEEPRTLLGLSLKGKSMGSSVAAEHVLLLTAEACTADDIRRMGELAQAAEKEYLQLDKDHAYTLFSVGLLAGAVTKEAVALLKRHKGNRTYETGWGMFRLAVVDTSQQKAFTNRNGKEFGQLLLARMKEENK